MEPVVRTRDTFLVNRALMIVAYVYGWEVANRLREMDIEVEYHGVLRRIKHIYVNGKLPSALGPVTGYSYQPSTAPPWWTRGSGSTVRLHPLLSRVGASLLRALLRLRTPRRTWTSP